MTGSNQRRMWVCAGVHPVEKKASGSGGIIAKAFRMMVPHRLELPNARMEKLVFLLGAAMDEQCPARHLDRDGFLPAWFHPSSCRDLLAGGRGRGFAR